MYRQRAKQIAKRLLPQSARMWLRKVAVWSTEWPTYGCVRFGSFRRTTPIHEGFGVGRGTYVDRYYIADFLRENADCIRGRVLELADNEYTIMFGGDRVTQSDILDVRPDYPTATIIADLTDASHIPSDAFDCIILTQTLQFIYDVRAAVRTVFRILKPGGTVLVSVPGISQLVPVEMEYCGDYWRFTHVSLRRIFEESFPAENLTVESRGNVLAAVALLHGLAAEELTKEELDSHDAGFEVVLLLRAVKS